VLTSDITSIDAIYKGHVIYTPSTFLELIPDRYKQKPITLYDPRDAPLLNQYRLIVPRTRNCLEVLQFVLLLGLYLAFMADRNPDSFSMLEVAFSVYAFGWVLDQFATILEHGWYVVRLLELSVSRLTGSTGQYIRKTCGLSWMLYLSWFIGAI
jgi:hypothetical protein